MPNDDDLAAVVRQAVWQSSQSTSTSRYPGNLADGLFALAHSIDRIADIAERLEKIALEDRQ